MNRTFYQRVGKRWLDAMLAFLGLVLVSPILIIAAIAVRLTSPGPVFFKQLRTGQSGEPFRIFKFRTMVASASVCGPLVTSESDERITTTGRWLRKTKVDELPQLINVLRGEMSIVGPRPEVPRFTAAYSDRQKCVFFAKPGITGLAAITYIQEQELLGNRADSEDFYLTSILPAKLELDLAYCENIRFLEDLKLVFLTISRILGARKPLPRAAENQT